MTGENSDQPIDDSPERDRESTEARLLQLASLGDRADALVHEHPELLTDVVRGLTEIDTAAFVSANPEVADRLQELLWTGLCEAVGGDALDDVSTVATVTFAAEDCSLAGHLEIDGEAGTIAGGPGRAENGDVTIAGEADVLVGLLAGDIDPKLGYLRGRFEIDGSTGTAMTLAPLLSRLSGQLPG
ncbi:SCP2 sterol-binding domain-containing protein [Halococcus agarilyticus]|uniref:SCP2 sterol-binding domain-containing protein n=1 Tax=Halococcus agarilyticus TaxID=1232219 RepID=UPI00067818A8|nr:SCP2 sterol-binding domain-containing protein [Halococcus agarilyticus]